MKATRRRNGKHMITVQVRFDLDGDELTEMLAQRYDEGEKPLTKAEAERLIRTHLWSNGGIEMDWQEKVSYDEAEVAKAFAWAREQVLRLWPEMTVREEA
jgi:hypothetical protein